VAKVAHYRNFRGAVVTD